jgi:putative nucleotidyltransferase with HDIG domain
MQIACTIQELEILQIVSAVADNLGYPCYAIGGFVRDKILGRATEDIDIVCVGDGLILAQQVAKQLPDNPQVNLFQTYGTAQIKTKAIEIEFVGARKESYHRESRNPMVEPGTLQDDQNRRDFTINAMAISLNKADFGEMLDPFKGIKHLQQKIIITPTEPDKTFIDDPLRMMRAIRFASQLGFAIEPYTFASIKENAARIRIITQERITVELNKIVMSKKPSIGFDLLEKSGLLKIIFPQMQDLKGVDVINGKGHKDNFYHTLQVLDNVSKTTQNLWLRWAAILHDIAKPATKKFEKGHGWTFHGHEHIGAKMIPRIFTNLKLPLGAEMKFVQKLVLLHLRPISLTKAEITDSAIRRLLFDAGEDIDELMQLCNADITSKDEGKVQRFRQNFELVKDKMIALEESDKIRNWQPVITGDIIMNTFHLKPSKPVGDLKNIIRDAILDGVIKNEFEEAFTYLLEKGKEMGLNPA